MDATSKLRQSLSTLIFCCLLTGAGTTARGDGLSENARLDSQEGPLALSAAAENRSSFLVADSVPPSPGPSVIDEAFTAVVHLRTFADWYRARRLGLPATQMGSWEYEVSEELLSQLRTAGIPFYVTGGTTRIALPAEFSQANRTGLATSDSNRLSPKAGETGTVQLFSGAINLPIEDNTGTAQGHRMRNLIAPAGAAVTDLRYRLRISDEGNGSFFCRDYEIWLFSGDVAFETRVYDNLGSRTDGGFDDDSADDLDIFLNWRSTSFFNGEDPNQWWGVLVWDNLSGDDGQLDFIEFEVDWEVESSGDSFEPDNSSGQAWPHPHNATSGPRSIDPVGDQDWIRFTLSVRSDVVVETVGPSGDTRMWLFDGSLNEIEFDDDGGSGFFSRIERTGSNALDPGLYFVKIDEFGNDEVIDSYGIELGVDAAPLPDLTAPSLSFTSFTPTEGDAFFIRTDVTNQGSGSAGASHARLFLSLDNDFDVSDDHEVLPEKSVSSLGPGQADPTRWDFSFPDLLDSPTYSVWMVVVVDSRNEVPESAENNVFKSNDPLTVSNANLDLEVVDVFFRDQPGNAGSIITNPLAGDEVFPHVTFRLNGLGSVTGKIWQIEIDSSHLCSSTDTIVPGSWVGWCNSPLTIQAGLHNLHGQLDPDGTVDESNEGNNDAFRNYIVCAQDAFEPDDSSSQASGLSPGASQSHSICPAGESDWMRFTLGEASQIVLETDGFTGDTRMRLFNSGLGQLEMDEDSGPGSFSRIDRLCNVDDLPAGTYFVEIDESGDDGIIGDYTLSLAVTPCATEGVPDIRIEPLALDFSESTQNDAIDDETTLATIENRTVFLQHGEIDPRQVPSFADSAMLSMAQALHMLMQFDRMPRLEERRVLSASGLHVLTYIPDQTYWVSVDRNVDTASIERTSGGPTWAWIPPPEYKMAAPLVAGVYSDDNTFEDGTVKVQALVFADVSREEAEAAMTAVDAVIHVLDWLSPRVALIRTPSFRVRDIASLDQIEWVEPAATPNAVQNATAAARIRADDLRSNPFNVDGQGITVGVWDEGSVFAHNDFGNRLTVADNVAVSDHSTHVAGTVGGSGANNANATGMAPGVQLRSRDWNNDGMEMRQAMGNGVTISNHSYGAIVGWHWHNDTAQWLDHGADLFGQYSTITQDWDDIVFDTDLLVFKSAGNDRNDCPSANQCDGPYDSIPHRGAAKNVITVCATEDNDAMTDFSSWGPTDDGRVKPDLCANGLSLTSTLPNNVYGAKSGTSMASPSGAGAAALLYDYFIDETGQTPAAATLKALLIHGARDLGRTGPDYEFGWGLVDVHTSADLITGGAWRTSSITATGNSQTFTITAAAQTPRLKATVVWTDPAGSPAAATALVNDLDLVLEAPDGTQVRPWILDRQNPAVAATRGANHVDNVEQVVVNNPQAGNWTLRVSGFAVPEGPQEFTVVAEGLSGGDTFTIFNDGNADLTVSSITPETSAPWISINPTNVTVVPGGSVSISVSVNLPQAPEGQTTTRLLVSSDDPDESPYPGGVFIHVDKAEETCFALTRTRTGQGSVPTAAPSSSTGCGSGSYHAGERITVNASPASGWSVGSWTGTDNDGSTSTSNMLTMPARNHTVTVHYVEDAPSCHALTRTHTGQGSDPTASPPSSTGCPTGQYVAGEVINLNASPASGWSVGSWAGTNNDASTSISNTATMPDGDHTVSIHYVTGGSCAALRTMPLGYAPNQPSPVNIDVNPDAGVQVYAVEETPPAGWNVSGIDNGGVFDESTGTVKWGPFFDNQPRSLHYSATPPTGTSGSFGFSGVASFDGNTESICGDSQLDPATLHPADLGDDWRMTIGEVTAYGAAWKTGATWSRPPNPIPIDYVTNAGFLWINGETYHFDVSQDPPWRPGSSAFRTAIRGTKSSGSAVSSFDSSSYTPGQPVVVTISVVPLASAQVYAVEDALPAGWTVSGISHAGSFDAVNGMVKWGPYFDNQSRVLTYTVTPPPGAVNRQTFVGRASFDGSSVPVTGDRAINEIGSIFTDGFESGNSSRWSRRVP